MPNPTLTLTLTQTRTRTRTLTNPDPHPGLKTVSVMCGQGLTQHAALLEAKLKQGSRDVFGEESGIRPIEGLVVFRASSTGASEESGVAPPEFDFDPGVMAASAARMGLAIPPEMLAE